MRDVEKRVGCCSSVNKDECDGCVRERARAEE